MSFQTSLFPLILHKLFISSSSLRRRLFPRLPRCLHLCFAFPFVLRRDLTGQLVEQDRDVILRMLLNYFFLGAWRVK